MNHLKCNIVLFWTLALNAYSQPAVIWGDTNEAIRMSISISNNVIAVGTTNVIQCQISNLLTNSVNFWGTPSEWTQVFLIDDSKNEIRLTKDPWFQPGGGPGFGIQPGETLKIQIPFTVRKQLSGNYKLRADIAMFIGVRPPTAHDSGLKEFKPSSNLLPVQLK